METKFNLYDVFGVLIPGGVLCVVSYYFLRGMGYTTGFESGWAQALVLLPVAYSAGTLLHHAARKFIYVRDHSLRLLTQEDKEFDAQFTRKLMEKAIEVFHLTPTPDEAKSDVFRQRLFKLCYDYVIQHNKGVYVENFNAYYGMCRSLMVVSIVSGLLAALWIFKADKNLLWLLPLVLAMIAAWRVFYAGLDSNARGFAVSVYRSFYIATACPPPTAPPKDS